MLLLVHHFKNYVFYPLKTHFNIKTLTTCTCTANFFSFFIWHSFYFMILLPVGYMFISTSHITYICERSIVHSPLIAYYRRIGKKYKWIKLFAFNDGKYNFNIFFHNKPHTKKRISIKTKSSKRTSILENKRSGVDFPTVHIQ